MGLANKPSLSRWLGVDTILVGPGDTLAPWPETFVSELIPRLWPLNRLPGMATSLALDGPGLCAGDDGYALVRSPEAPGECLRTMSPPTLARICLVWSLRPDAACVVHESKVTDLWPWCRGPRGGGIARPGESSPAVVGVVPSRLTSCLDVFGLLSTSPSGPALLRGPRLPRRTLLVLCSGRLVLLPFVPAVAGVVAAPPP
jgi:hypothetical protein